MLIAQLPAKPDYLRVKLRRRIQRLGAVALKGGVYALPDREDTAEDFVWLRTELLADGADAIICTSTMVAGTSDAELEALFRAARDEDYGAVGDEARTLLDTRSRDEAVRALPRMRRRLEEIDRIDFFAARAREEAQRAVDRLGELATGRSENVESAKPSGATPRGRTWVTREGIFVDRIASAWLVRRFIDPSATFKFVASRGYTPLPGELRFDMFGGEYTHEGDRCTFETLLDRFTLDDPALRALAEIVHDIDCKDAKYDRPEAAGMESILAGLVRAQSDDARRLEQGSAIMDALYAQLGGRRG